MSKESMKLALEALEYWDVHGKLHQPTEEAIAAIKQALEQPVQEPVVIPDDVRKIAKAMQKDGYRGPLSWARTVINFVATYESPPAQPTPVQEPVAMRMPTVGDRVVCIEDESLGTVVYLTAGGSPEIKFDDGSHGTYMLREFAELFGYTTPPAQEFICSTGLCHYKPAAAVQLAASLKEADVLMIAEAHGIDPRTKGLYGFYIDCISTTPPAALVQEPVACECNQGQVCHVCDPITPPAAQPVPEQYAALEQALTRLQKRYGELEARLAAQPTTKESSAVQQEPVQEPDAMGCKCAECGAWQRWTPSGMVCKNGHGGASGINQRLYTTPPAAQRQWVGLTEKEVGRLWSDAHNDTSDRMAFQVLAAYIEDELKELNA